MNGGAISETFPRYSGEGTTIPVYCISQQGQSTIHRFYDTSPVSPSGRYAALTELPYEDKLPVPGDVARVIVTDLTTGERVFEATTAAWDTQVGAHAQWGSRDDALYFNRVGEGDWRPYGVRVNPFTGAEALLESPVYVVSNSGAFCLSPNLSKITLCQAGYGLNSPSIEQWRHCGAPEDDGLFLTDTATGKTRLLVSLAEIAALLEQRNVAPDLSGGGLYGFHAKWNHDDSRIMFLVRWLAAGEFQARTRNFIVTVRPDGSDLSLALDATRWVGGHHPNWCPDGESIVMNLRFRTGNPLLATSGRFVERLVRKVGLNLAPKYDRLRFAQFRYDGSGLRTLSSTHEGSGHPTVHRDGRYLVSDAYTGESVAFGDGSVPIRVLDLQTDIERCVVRMQCNPMFPGPRHELRVDPHPAWDPTQSWIIFNGCPNGPRQVFLGDMTSVLGEGQAQGASTENKTHLARDDGAGSGSPRAAGA